LTTVTIGSGVRYISTAFYVNGPFFLCDSLTDIDVDNDNTSYSSINGVLFNKAKTTLLQYPRGKQGAYTIPNSVTSIGERAFYGCRSLTSITIPNSVISIGLRAFEGCTGLTSIISLRVVPSGADTAAFASVRLDSVCLFVPQIAISAYRSADVWKGFSCINAVDGALTVTFDSRGGSAVSTQYVFTGYSVVKPADPTRSGYVFDRWYKDTLCTEPWVYTDSVTQDITLYAKWWRDDEAYEWNCGNAVRAVLLIADGTLTISGTGYMRDYDVTSSDPTYTPWYGYRSSITRVIVEDGVTDIGGGAFYGCTGLTSVTIPNSVTSIGSGAFSSCVGLTLVTSLTEVPPTLGTSAFVGVNAALLYVPEGSAGAYRAADQWKRFGIIDGSPVIWECGASPNTAAVTATLNTTDSTLTISGTGAMADYTSTTVPWAIYRNFITSATIEEGVTNIGNYAFYNCTGLSSATIPSSVTSIGNYAFYGCTGLTSVTIPNGVTSIGEAAFYGCTGLTSVTIPNGVTSIGNYVFYNCTGLTSVTSLIDVPPTINSNVFTNVPVASATLYVPEDAVEAYRAADVWKSFVTIEAKPKNSVTSGDRVIPQTKPNEEATVIAPTSQLSGEFTAGPNPVLKQSGIVNFYRQGKRVSNSELRIYDANGNVINKVKISDKAMGSQARRQVGSWDLCDRNGRIVPEGTYLVKGVVKTSDGKSEKVSVIVGVR
jgi:uncharacterized repeat protein (TIGR02543 family)